MLGGVGRAGEIPALTRLCSDFDVLNSTRWRWNGIAIFAESFQVKFDSLANGLLCFMQGRARCHAAGKIRNVGRVIATGILNHNRIAHGVHLFLQSGLLQDTAESAGSQIVARLASNGDSAGFDWVLELPMTAFS
jgi:hypothetical protein